jgi:hypothetical protein
MTATVPPEFSYFCLQFHQDVGLIHGTGEKIIAVALKALDQNQKIVVRDFLDKLLGGEFEPGEVKDIWNNSPADIMFSTGEDALKFLRMVRAEMT